MYHNIDPRTIIVLAGVMSGFMAIILPRLLLPLGLFWAYVVTQRFFCITPRFWPAMIH